MPRRSRLWQLQGTSRCHARGSRRNGIRCRLSQRHQTGELSDVAGFELVEGGNAEQLHGATDLVRQDLDRAVDTLAPARHEPVEVRASDESEARAHGNGCDDVGAVPDLSLIHIW